MTKIVCDGSLGRQAKGELTDEYSTVVAGKLNRKAKGTPKESYRYSTVRGRNAKIQPKES